MHDSINLAMDAVPAGIDPVAVRSYLEDLSGVTAVHDLHIWAMSTTETALTAHLEHEDPAVDLSAVTAEAGRGLRQRFGIGHSTLQWERVTDRAKEEGGGIDGGRQCREENER